MKRMCFDEIKEYVRKLVEGCDDLVAASALRELAAELDPDYSDLTEGSEE